MEMVHKRHMLQGDGLEICRLSALFCSLIRCDCHCHLVPFPSETGAQGTCQSHSRPNAAGHLRDGGTRSLT